MAFEIDFDPRAFIDKYSSETQTWGDYSRTTQYESGSPYYSKIKNNKTGNSKITTFENGKIKSIDYKYSVMDPKTHIAGPRQISFSRINGKNILSYFNAEGTTFLRSSGLTLSDEYLKLTPTAKEIKYVKPIILKKLGTWARLIKI